ncbi:hypothetical protein L7F22_016879 [Adiantum nelumboides]|nr:hypothetical protein [Adiantum nelumboides]
MRTSRGSEHKSYDHFNCKVGILWDSTHKRWAIEGNKKTWCKKRKYELGHQSAMTKLSSNKSITKIHVQGGNFKFRALRLDTGNYFWGSKVTTTKIGILDVVYNALTMSLSASRGLVCKWVPSACISPHPGQCRQANGYILEGKELEFYERKIQRKKEKTTGSVL